ncbi:MAG: phosphoenolpyruvate synthase [Desulfobulbus sp.]|jgi:pyruvate,water dikinase|uniref:PEP/pyruvate-binding domain-containing protein n=1 Tax=Desulfobulbus sp. TaxID=895 RepID=UPI002849E399|nr:PEP/pyruvate-binding domain-containing protein [Desulfobulbus sp.]MDR2551143.1 phosphoenolpyruvate synthase [Desulfobulbus sp.]
MATILGNLKQLFKELRSRNAADQPGSSSEMNALFRFRYALFKELLVANSELLTVLSDMDEKLKGETVFGLSYITNQVNKSLRNAFQMVKSLNVMSGGKHRDLYMALEQINGSIKTIIEERKAESAPQAVMPYAHVLLKDADWAGGKNANLGEIKNRLNIPVPEGFAITTKGFHDFFEYNDLKEAIIEQKNLIYVNEFDLLNNLSAETLELVRSKPLPPELERDILAACTELWGDDPSVLVAMRSSAVGEDGDISYAGQYLTLLGVTRPEVCEAYKSIIGSLFSARSIAYRGSKGVYDEDLAMAVACLKMVDSRASGVLYTRHPYDITNEHILINAVWGLGPYAVDGVITPDAYSVTKDAGLILQEKIVAAKPVQLRLNIEGGVEERPVPEDMQKAPCLSDDQIRVLAGYGAALERHYKCPQDVEWALDPDGQLLILQSRPLKIQSPTNFCLLKAAPLKGYELIVDGGEIASQGVGKGTVVHVRSMDDLADFPEGGVLIARHSSPEYVIVMRQASAIVVEAGSVSGHMAALAREFDVPTLICANLEMDRLPSGMEVTVDAYTGRIYAGTVTELLAAIKKEEAHMKGTPIYDQLERIAKHVIPLNLVNPEAPEFTPTGCSTLHDLARYCHEYSYKEMFQISDLASKFHGWSLKLDAALPMDIHLIDLGNGLKEGAVTKWNSIKVEEIDSVPFLALLQGMLNKEVHGLEPRPVNFSGLLSVIREQSLSPGHVGARFGDRSYAIIADKYLNFSSRVGYHYSVIDAYCGDTINKNYITFTFKGGAADDVRKNRRVRAIANILDREGFKVRVKADKVDARLQKYPKSYIESRMDILGRLLIFTRQLDMLMTTEHSVEWVADNFVAGNYKLTAPPVEA